MTAAVLTIATTGPIATKADNPALPTTPQEIADAAHAAYLAGAAVAHIHVRDETADRPLTSGAACCRSSACRGPDRGGRCRTSSR